MLHRRALLRYGLAAGLLGAAGVTSWAALREHTRVPRIRLHPDPILRKPASPVPYPDRVLAHQLTRTLRYRQVADFVTRAKFHQGLSAPQIGISVRAVALGSGLSVRVLFNPILEEEVGTRWGYETCLSLPDHAPRLVKRGERIRVRHLSNGGRSSVLEVSGLTAAVLAHELDHLDGVLYIDRATA